MNKTTHPIEPEELMAYLDGELSSDRAEAAAAHLSECLECRGLVSELRGVSQAFKAWDIESSDLRVPPTVLAALEESMGQRGRISVAHQSWRDVFRKRWQSAAWMGAFAAIALFAYFGSLDFVSYKKVALPVDRRPVGATGAQNSLQTYYSLNAPAPPSHPVGGLTQARKRDRAEMFADKEPTVDVKAASNRPTINGPMIIRTAELALITKDFDNARSAMEAILKRHRGYVGELKVGGSTGSGRTLTATLRVPADQLDASLTDLKTLGRVESESQSGQDVTSQYVDLQARLANARNTERRLTDLLRQRTGKLSDVLEVEQEVDRVRGEIEQMEAERKNMSNQVSFATLNVTIAEDYKAQLQVVPPSTSTRLSNAAVAGYKSMVDGVVSLVLFLLENGPSLLFWLVVLFFPARLAWKRLRRSFAQ
jgi:hypothetical protein